VQMQMDKIGVRHERSLTFHRQDTKTQLTLPDFRRTLAVWARFITATTSNEYKTSARRSFRFYDNGHECQG
jgi:hypothetical protein